uniref:Uncharacterized protein n=1 Tax=Arundo donax TaxID=35708 RepID=A0A0A9F1J5_ARUDO
MDTARCSGSWRSRRAISSRGWDLVERQRK